MTQPMRFFKETARRVLAQGRRFDFIEVDAQTPSGHTVHKQGIHHPGAVIILPILDTPEGRLPHGWKIGTLAELCEGKGGIQTGPFGSQLHQEDYSEVGIPVLMPKNLLGLRVVEHGIARIPGELADSLSRHIMAEGDIVYGRRGDIGRRAYIGKRQRGYFCGTGCLRLRPAKAKVAPRYLFDALGSPLTEGTIKGRASGVTMPNISAGIMQSIPVLAPPFDLQSRYQTVTDPIRDQIDNLHVANERLAASRDLLLPRLMSGPLSFKCANVELEAVI